MTFFAATAVALSSLSASFLRAGRAGLPMATSAARALSRTVSCRSVILSPRILTQASMAGSGFSGESFLASVFLAVAFLSSLPPEGCASAGTRISNADARAEAVGSAKNDRAMFHPLK